MSAPDEDREPIYICEECGKPLCEGDIVSGGGEDCIYFCDEHSPMLSDSVDYWRRVQADGEWEGYDYWDSEEDFAAWLFNMERDLADNGDRKDVRKL